MQSGPAAAAAPLGAPTLGAAAWHGTALCHAPGTLPKPRAGQLFAFFGQLFSVLLHPKELMLKVPSQCAMRAPGARPNEKLCPVSCQD